VAAEKLTEKKRVRMSASMAKEIETIAELEHRHFQDQARLFLELGIEAYRASGKGPMSAKKRLMTPGDAQGRTEDVA
jgi:hypothetical protein